jgi:hypothetical protein
MQKTTHCYIQGVPECLYPALLEICRVGGRVRSMYAYWAPQSGMLPQIIISQLKLIMRERRCSWTYVIRPRKEKDLC